MMHPSARPALSLLVLFVFVLVSCDALGEQSTENDAPPAEALPGTAQEDGPFAAGAYPMEVERQGAGMYRQSKNELTVTVPFVSPDSLLLESNGRRVGGANIAVMPTGDDISITAYKIEPDSAQRLLRTRTFSVIDPPHPEIKVLDGSGREIISGDRISIARPVIDFLVEPDREFALDYPTDARYRIQRARVAIQSGLSSSQAIGTFALTGGSTLKLIRELRSASPGDLLLIELRDVIRINAETEAIPVSLPESSRSFAFVLS